MNAFTRIMAWTVVFATGTTALSSFSPDRTDPPAFRFPYEKAGLTSRQAAVHLLNRFTFGPRPGDVELVCSKGLEQWFLEQLEGKLPDGPLDARLESYDALHLTNSEVLDKYPRKGQVLRMAMAEGVVDTAARGKADPSTYKSELAAFMKQKGFEPQQELYRQLASQKILRAAYSHNQLRELLTDFWFNHFNVALNKNQCAQFVPAYERDVIRPNVSGNFEDMLIATAQSPAMLAYLDNFSSAGADENTKRGDKGANRRNASRPMQNQADANQGRKIKKPKTRGLNENYARELMELHTMGVDGGYTQQDVTEAARVLTGWTIYHGDFLFAANRHDTQEKAVLGKQFPADGGYEEGIALLKMLANHPATAKFICRKIAIRFVSDDPSEDLVDEMARTFADTKGAISQVLITMASSDEFWSEEARLDKIKSPFELAISAVRSVDAEITQPYQLYQWIARMGQRMYYYQAPTGFPDKAEYWINTGALLNRMNFGLALTAQRIPGIQIDLAHLNHHQEPESTGMALEAYSRIMMPERDLDETVQRLTPMLSQPDLAAKVAQAARQSAGKAQGDAPAAANAIDQNSLAQVVGVIIGSPEFQRR